MHMRTLALLLGLGTALLLPATEPRAQQAQIPTLQVCNKTEARGTGIVKIDSRVDSTHSGTFKIRLELACDVEGYPTGQIAVTGLSMTDSIVEGTWASTSIEQLTSVGEATPTLYVNGRCRAERAPGCRFWLMAADNRKGTKGTPDIVSFLVLDGKGQRVAYATGPVVDPRGDIIIAPTSN